VLIRRIAILPSVRLSALLCIAHLAAVAGIGWSTVALWPKVLLIGFVAASLVYLLARYAALHTGDAIVALEIHDDGVISYQTRLGDWVDCSVLGSSFVSHRLTIVNLRPHGRRSARHVILVPDNVDARDFRRLRIWLRWAAQFAGR
jgi:toxin CptA